MISRKLRIGVLINSSGIPAWTHKILTEIDDSNYAEIKLFIKNNSLKPKQTFIKKIFELRNSLLYILFIKADRKIIKIKQDALEPRNINGFSSVPVMPVIPIQTKFSDRFPDEAILRIKKYDLDVLLKFGFGNLKGNILQSSKYGVWVDYHDIGHLMNGVLPGFWEVMQNCPETGSTLHMLVDDTEAGKVLFRSFSMTDSHSITRNLNTYYWKSVKFIPRKLKELFLFGEDIFFNKLNKENQHSVFYSQNPYKIPTNIEMTFLLGKHVIKYIMEKFSEFFYFQQWQLQYAIDKDGKPSQSFIHFKKIIPPKDRFWADPDFIKKDGKYYIFYEEYIYSKKKAHISLIEMDEDGNLSDPKIVLRKNYHLSFPFVFNVDNNYYMIPETSGNKTIELYRCVNFPERWELENVLMDNIVAADANLFFNNNKWWLFVNIKENEGASLYDELFLFFSNDFKSNKWTSHPQNPLISDVKSARPAGHIFQYNNNIYRPSQNCSKRYGYGMKMNQILILNENEYQEKVVGQLEPNWEKNYLGVHTLNYKEDFTIIDVLVKRNKFFK